MHRSKGGLSLDRLLRNCEDGEEGVGHRNLHKLFSTCKFFSLSLPDTVVPGLGFHVRVSGKGSVA